MAGVTALICLAVFAALALVSRTRKPDLFDLVPKESPGGSETILAWNDLERGHRALKAGAVATGSPARALGYMAAREQPIRDGQPVTRFVVVPDPGFARHPPRLYGDQMIEVRLREGETIVCPNGQLLWVQGTLRVLPGNPNGQEPLYQLFDASAQIAKEGDIRKYFR
jgi:hypothetical protein